MLRQWRPTATTRRTAIAYTPLSRPSTTPAAATSPNLQRCKLLSTAHRSNRRFLRMAWSAYSEQAFRPPGVARGAGLGDFVNGAFPTVLGCVGVEVTGPGLAQPVRLPIAFVNSSQINAQMPQFTGTGPLGLTVILNPDLGNAVRSAMGTLNTSLQAFAPAFFLIPNSTTVAAENVTKPSIVANPTLVPGASPARPGDIVSLFGTGFGTTNPPFVAGQIATGQPVITEPLTVKIGDVTLANVGRPLRRPVSRIHQRPVSIQRPHSNDGGERRHPREHHDRRCSDACGQLSPCNSSGPRVNSEAMPCRTGVP